MKSHLLIVLSVAILLVASNSHAAMTRETGGMPQPPRAVVIQAHVKKGVIDTKGKDAVLSIAASHLIQNRLITFAQRDESQDKTKVVFCIEYKDYSDSLEASAEYKEVLKGHSTIEVVEAMVCRY